MRDEVRKVFHTVMLNGDTLGLSNFENEIVGKSGERFNIAWSNVLTTDATGNVVDVLVWALTSPNVSVLRKN